MSYAHPEALVSTQWLADHLSDPTIRIVDATLYFGPKKAVDDFNARRIPGAAFFDVDAISDKSNPLPTMLPSADHFAAAMKALGIDNATHVIAYDSGAMLASARAWWMLRVFGHDKVSVLDGGLGKWQAEGRPMETGAPSSAKAGGAFVPKLRPDLVRDYDAMLANVSSNAEAVLDARAAGRFNGVDPETRPGSRGGHIPGSMNLPYGNILQGEHKTFAPADELRAQIVKAGVKPDQAVAVSCGGGISAPVLALGLYLIGNKDVSVYDGSWNEWGTRADAPIEK